MMTTYKQILLAIVFFFTMLKGVSQSVSSFISDGQRYSIEEMNYYRYNISNAFIFVVTDYAEYDLIKKNIADCKSIKQNNTKIFLVRILDNAESTKNYLAMVKHILSSYKLLDSRLFIIDYKDFTEEYKSEAKQNRIQKASMVLNFENLTINFCDQMEVALNH